MDFIISRAKGLFQYGDLDSGIRESSSGNTMDLETDGINSANTVVRKRKRCIWLWSLTAAIAAIIIIAVAVKNRHHLATAAADLLSPLPQKTSHLSSRPVPDKDLFRFTNFISYSFYPKFFNGTWISDTEILFSDQYGGLSINNVATHVIQTVVSHNQFRQFHPVEYEFSADRQYLLLKTSSARVWRRSSIGKYSIHRMVAGRPSGSLIPLIPANSKSNDLETEENDYLRYVSWAPVDNALVYVDYNNNIHYRHSAEAQDVQLTNSGNETKIYNGIPDWVSEEEVFEDNKALWWSPDGTKLVYGVFNDSLVEVVMLPRYGNWKTEGTNRQGYPFLQYSSQDNFRYPKAGGVNPTVTLWFADVGEPGRENTITQDRLPPPNSLAKEEHHFTAVTWQDNSTVAVNWMNRYQNFTAISVCPLADNDITCREVFVIRERDGWVDYKFRIVYNKYKPGHRFLAIMPAATKFRLRQLWLVDTDADTHTMLTNHLSEVTQIVEWTRDDQIYYISTLPEDPGARHLYRVQLGQEDSAPECLSCNHQEMIPHLQQRKTCQFVEVAMSKSGSYYTMTCKGPGIPYSCLHHTQTNSLISVWEDNLDLEDTYSNVDSPVVEYTQVPVPGTTQQAQVVIYRPPGVTREPGKKWPMLVQVYGGPGFQMVDQTWQGYSYSAFLAAAMGVVYVIIDPRGSGFQGDAWRHSVYRNFGSVEVTDTIAVTKWLQNNLDYVDSGNTAIWGWSYGGYLSLSALTQDVAGVFKCGASVAPVVRWELYDTIYTERYMSTPQDNPAGYNSSSPLLRISNLRNKQYYLIHGTHDDNVHYQQSMLLSSALEQKDILFKQQSYPDQDHSISDYRRHLYHSLTHFFVEECFHLNQS